MISDNCSPDKTSCCCKNSESKTSTAENLEKKCCCEIKESSNQPADVYLNVNETFAKNLTLTSNFYSGIIFNSADFNASNFRILSFHSPPNESINILNSNFRI